LPLGGKTTELAASKLSPMPTERNLPTDHPSVHRSPGPRRSPAALRSGRRRDTEGSIALALAANVVVAAAKLTVGLAIGSAAMLAEAIHSAADSINEVLLGISVYHGRRPADSRHPLGHAGARFVWAFLAAIFSFVVGGCVSVALAVYELLHGSPVDSFTAAWIVLGVALVADGASLGRSLFLARREAALWGLGVASFLRSTSEPSIRAIVVEDAAAIVGVLIASGGLLLHQLAGLESADGIAALLIGLLLAVTAAGLARPLVDLLIGRSVGSERLERIRRIVAASPGVERIVMLYATYEGPQEVFVTAKVRPAAQRSTSELANDMDEIDRSLRRELPEVAEVFIDVTADTAMLSDRARAPRGAVLPHEPPANR
jgi:cation diffusion facilitator family transporter